MEKCADVLDLAQAHSQRETELMISLIRQETSLGIGRHRCIDCGQPIPAARRLHVPNAKRCAACQAAIEHRRHPIQRSAS